MKNQKQTPLLRAMVKKLKNFTKDNRSLHNTKIINQPKLGVQSKYIVTYNLEEGC